MSVSKRTRFKVFDRDDYRCRYCGKNPTEGVVLEVDHVTPRSKGGDDSTDNLVTSCFDCNRGKSDLSIKGNHEEPDCVSLKRIQEMNESKARLAEKKKAERQRKKEIQEWVDTICEYFAVDNCPVRIASDCARLSKEFGANMVLDWISKISGKFTLPDGNANKYLNGIARRVREESL